MVESYKTSSRLITLIVFIAVFITTNQETILGIINPEYHQIFLFVVLIAGYVVTQFSEEKRVNHAEKLVEEEYA